MKMTVVLTRVTRQQPAGSGSGDVFIPVHEGRVLVVGLLLVLLADLDAVRHVAHALPLEESELPEDERDDDHDEEAGHDADHHHPHRDGRHPSLRQTVREGHHAHRRLVVAAHLLRGERGRHLQPRARVDDDAVDVRVVLDQGGVPDAGPELDHGEVSAPQPREAAGDGETLGGPAPAVHHHDPGGRAVLGHHVVSLDHGLEVASVALVDSLRVTVVTVLYCSELCFH